MKTSLKIVYVEDSLDDLGLVEKLLKAGGVDCDIHRVDSRRGLIDQINKSDPDLVLSDYSLPGFDGHAALTIVRALKPELPFIFFSGTISQDAAIELLREGATDYVFKDRRSRLVPAIRSALAEAKERVHVQIIQRRLQQARRMEALGTMASGIAHDFNNLLAVIKVHAGLLQSGSLSPEQISQMASMLDRAADRGTELTLQLSIFGRKATANPVYLQVKSKVCETVSFLNAILPPTVSVDVQLDDSLPRIFMDASHLDRILTNLITNAADAMPNGGLITISSTLNGPANPSPRFGYENEIPYLCLKIADTGTGMDSRTREHALEPFYTTKPAGKGTGLGLSVVFGLMQIHNGLFRLESEEGKGTTVSLFFPLDSKYSKDAKTTISPSYETTTALN